MSGRTPGRRLLVLHLRTNGEAEFLEIEHTLAELQRLVGGYIEPIALTDAWRGRGLLGLVDEDGVRKGVALNPFNDTLLRAPTEQALFSRRHIVGDALILRTHAEEFATLTQRDRLLLQETLETIGVKA